MCLGGLKVPHDRELIGHSDADVLLHAVTDALLGAAALGDIGEMFPDTDPANRGRDSGEMLRMARDAVASAGWRVVNVDCIVFAQRPKLGPHKAQIGRRLAELLGVRPDQVAVKAKTGEGIGEVGREEVIAAQCVALLEAGEGLEVGDQRLEVGDQSRGAAARIRGGKGSEGRCGADSGSPTSDHRSLTAAPSNGTETTKVMIRVYNTLSKNKEPFQPVQAGKVGIYLCGPTVYKPSHIGHMVGPVIFDAVKRYLAYSGYQVTLVINMTDVDDKLIAESNARKIPMAQLAEEMIADYMANLKAMGIDSVDHFPRATEHITHIINFTGALVKKGFAYESEGDVYFDVSKFDGYGKLSHRTLESMQLEGGSTAERKRNAADFALWKSAKPGEPSWPSPWGNGRPGCGGGS